MQLKITTEEFQEAHYGRHIIGRTFGMSIGRVRERTRGFAEKTRAGGPSAQTESTSGWYKALPARILKGNFATHRMVASCLENESAASVPQSHRHKRSGPSRGALSTMRLSMAAKPKFNGLYHDFHTHARSPGDPGVWVLATPHFGSWAAELPAAPLRWAG